MKALVPLRIKETNNGSRLKNINIYPKRYKVGVIDSYLHKAYDVSSNNEIFETEVTRIKLLLTNNNFLMRLIEKKNSQNSWHQKASLP